MTADVATRTRVLQLLAPHAVGGIETVVRHLATGLDPEAFEVRVAAMVPEGGPGERWVAAVREAGVRCERLPATRLLRGELATLQAVFSDFAPAIVHSHGYRADILAALLRRRGRGWRHFSTMHGFTPTTWRLHLYSALGRRAVRGADRVLAVAPRIRDILVKAGVPCQRIAIRLNAVAVVPAPEGREDLRRHEGLPTDAVVLGTVTRLSKEKAPLDLIEAFAAVTADFPSAYLMIVGDGPEAQKLQTRITSLGLGNRIRLLGERRDIERLYPCLDAFILPSHTEGCPTALIEAFGYGVPAVATTVGAVPLMMEDGVQGLLVPPRRPPLLARALAEMLSRPDRRRAMASAAHERYQAAFRLPVWLEAMAGEYRRLAPSPAPPSIFDAEFPRV